MVALSMETEMKTTKAELARKLKVSPAYITLISQGKRTPSRKLQRKVNRLGLTNAFKNLNGVQVVGGSNPLTPTFIPPSSANTRNFVCSWSDKVGRVISPSLGGMMKLEV